VTGIVYDNEVRCFPDVFEPPGVEDYQLACSSSEAKFVLKPCIVTGIVGDNACECQPVVRIISLSRGDTEQDDLRHTVWMRLGVGKGQG
jgi:hypothetical protein